MKANRSPLAASALGLAPLALAMLAALSGCVEAPRQAASAPPPAPPPAAPAPLPAVADWRDAPASPGDWTWSHEGAASVARFAGRQFSVRCAGAGGPVQLERAGAAGATEPMTVTTTAGSRPLTGQPYDDAGPVIAVSLAPRDPLLDAMAFSRGRVAVDVAGMAPLYVPAWPEIARVIEDCR